MQSLKFTTIGSAGRVVQFAAIVCAALVASYLVGRPTGNPRPAGVPSPLVAAAPHFKAHQKLTQWRAPLLVGVEVYGVEGTPVGKVKDVLMNHDGVVQTVVIGVGGLLGFGEKNVAVPFSAVQWSMNQRSDAPVEPPSGAAAAAPAPFANSAPSDQIAEAAQGRPDEADVAATLSQLQSAPSFSYASRAPSITEIGGASGEGTRMTPFE
jgi:sporulation protein YlmC with PRC-barrel domain